MKQTIDESDFIRAFTAYGRQDQFSRAGLRALFEYLEQLEQDCEMEIELDVIALCCDYHEIDVKDIKRETGCESLEDLQDNTTVIQVDDETIIYQSF
jgi:hypothetical protein